jgi:hypothetical protein
LKYIFLSQIINQSRLFKHFTPILQILQIKQCPAQNSFFLSRPLSHLITIILPSQIQMILKRPFTNYFQK